jgi:hypothetical protein
MTLASIPPPRHEWGMGRTPGRSHLTDFNPRPPDSEGGKRHFGHAVLACSLHSGPGMVEAIGDQWAIVVVAATVAWPSRDAEPA